MSAQDIQIWQCDIAGSAEAFPDYWAMLEPYEQEHAVSISNQQSRQNYVAIHAKLRILLAGIVNSRPEDLRILKAEYGRPYLADYPELSFNLSHTGSKLLIAYSYTHVVGVDIETCKPRASLPGLVEKCFAEEERQYWQGLPESEQTQAFYRFWTRKEAFVKAVGRGIALGLNQCIINPLKHNQLLRIPEAYGKPGQWVLQDIEVNKTICGALAAKKFVLSLR